MLPDSLKECRAAAALEAWDASAIVDGTVAHGEATVWVPPERIAAVCRFLKSEAHFARLSGITAVDWHPAAPRFELVYHLHCFEPYERLRLKVRIAEGADAESVTAVWANADWYEREVFDLFGIRFRNHPNLRRIVLPENWEGYPLRKDYPVHGHKYDYKEEAEA